MKLGRFISARTGYPSLGIVHGDRIYAVTDDIFDTGRFDPERAEDFAPLSEARLLAPVQPTKIVCVGRNYREHAAELGNTMPSEPLLFLKAPSSLVGHGAAIELPAASQRVEHEGELAVVIGRECRRVSDAENPLNYVMGYTCLNDVTARDLQKKDVQFTRAKSFDTFCPVGPFVETELDPLDVQVETRVNGEVRQRGRTSVDRKSTRLNSSHANISYAVFCLKKKK